MSDVSFQNNVPDPLLSGKELPTFKFELEKSKAKFSETASARK
jgi:oxalate decarboxylase